MHLNVAIVHYCSHHSDSDNSDDDDPSASAAHHPSPSYSDEGDLDNNLGVGEGRQI